MNEKFLGQRGEQRGEAAKILPHCLVVRLASLPRAIPGNTLSEFSAPTVFQVRLFCDTHLRARFRGRPTSWSEVRETEQPLVG